MTLQDKWKIFWDLLSLSNDELNKYLKGNLSLTDSKNIKKFLSSFDKMKDSAEKVDDMISSPIDAIDVKSPWDDETFKSAWQYWLDYRLESFGKTYKSREENKVLEYLKEISEGDERKAIKYLDFAMAGSYPRFFKLDEKQFNKLSKNDTKDTDSDFD